MTSSAIRDLLKVISQLGVISLAGGLPAPEGFPIDALLAACERVLRSPDARTALQYSPSEGLPALRRWVAESLPWPVHEDQVLITTGSQQALDLVAKALIDKGSVVLVGSPSYLGAQQVFTTMQAKMVSVACDADGMLPEDLAAKAAGARFLYLQPNYENPTGTCMSAERREAIGQVAARLGLVILEDNPYGDLWYRQPPPAPLAAKLPENTIYTGSFSKILAPGMRLGYLVAPMKLYQTLVKFKQAADLHSASFNQHVVLEVLRDGFLDRHLPAIRELYQRKRNAMLAALDRHMRGLGASWNRPSGGMFIWLRLPEGLSATALLPRAVEKGVAYVPGTPFFAGDADERALRLSYVTATEAQIDAGIALLAKVVQEALEALPTEAR
ncbi:aminotransferase class I/II-fold pyridoxal phosphate-dependent enzyme [Xylophilus rhododendri]|uniref:Aminotransferase class I/II-fold pyridoxal phosphate-dependent enzyme n=2 Tax=Xylophilus rhododendri TaxID=2697032 RepID=A0A857JF94_9BURK|nr:aminotransferase class I/II-fold pyridoxal phosphate-dependent enzyme [Xylophilus rhododendri]